MLSKPLDRLIAITLAVMLISIETLAGNVSSDSANQDKVYFFAELSLRGVVKFSAAAEDYLEFAEFKAYEANLSIHHKKIALGLRYFEFQGSINKTIHSYDQQILTESKFGRSSSMVKLGYELVNSNNFRITPFVGAGVVRYLISSSSNSNQFFTHRKLTYAASLDFDYDFSHNLKFIGPSAPSYFLRTTVGYNPIRHFEIASPRTSFMSVTIGLGLYI